MVYRRQAMLGLHERSRYAFDLAFSYCEPHRATGGASMGWRGSGFESPQLHPQLHAKAGWAADHRMEPGSAGPPADSGGYGLVMACTGLMA